MARILIIEDEIRVAELLKRGLVESGHTVSLALNASTALQLFGELTFDMIISDVILPDGSGFELCQQIRSRDTNIPILMLTALGTTDDKLAGFNSGADDYMVKPFDFRELDARIHVLLKRRGNDAHIRQIKEIQYADLKINLQTRSVSRQNIPILLTPKEYNLLLFLRKSGTRIIQKRNRRKSMGYPFRYGH